MILLSWGMCFGMNLEKSIQKYTLSKPIFDDCYEKTGLVSDAWKHVGTFLNPFWDFHTIKNLKLTCKDLSRVIDCPKNFRSEFFERLMATIRYGRPIPYLEYMFSVHRECINMKINSDITILDFVKAERNLIASVGAYSYHSGEEFGQKLTYYKNVIDTIQKFGGKTAKELAQLKQELAQLAQESAELTQEKLRYPHQGYGQAFGETCIIS